MTREALRALLERHAPADEKERRDLATILEVLEHEGRAADPFARTLFEPGHLTGSAFVLDAEEKNLLMLHHGRLNRWLQPGGHGEPGESDPFLVALREATEESGIAGLAAHPRAPRPFDVDVHAIPAKVKNGVTVEPPHAHLDLRFVLVAPAGAIPVLSEESHALEWRPLALAAGAGDADAALRRAIAKVRELVGR
jgi:8-oxo-dGTP pyrophosphatase MutT (NUDIX family)